MSRTVRIIRNVMAVSAAALVLLAGAAVIVLHTAWFQNWVRGKIVAAIADGTGGKTEIGSFSLDVFHLRARIQDLVIHGTEPPTAAPFVRVAQVDLNARLFSAGRLIAITYLGVQKPAVNILVSPEGQTNIPTPKPSPPSKKTALETAVDLAVGHFDLTKGVVTLNDRPQPLEVSANNLHVQLWYRLASDDYTGLLSLEPVYVAAGRNTPVTYNINLPVVLERDRIRLQGASITSANSRIKIDGSIEHIRQPEFSGRAEGRLAIIDLDRTLNLRLPRPGRGVPDVLQLDVNAAGSSDQVRVTSAAISLGRSHLEASGILKDAHKGSSLKFEGSLALPEIARLAGLKAQPEGSLLLNGEATVDGANRYRVGGHVLSRGLAFRQGTVQIRSAALSTNVLVEPGTVRLSDLHVDAFGGEFAGNATLQEFARYHVTGGLRHFDVEALSQLAGQKLPYSGEISGPVEASGNLKAAAAGLAVNAKLAIAPGKGGIPVRGRIAATYTAAPDDIRIESSYLELPHTRITAAGSLQHSLNLSLTTRDLHDLLAAVPKAGPVPVTLGGGEAGFTGTINGTLRTPRIAGRVSATNFQVEGRQFTAFSADADASPAGVSVRNGALTRGTMSAAFSGSVGLRDWKLVQEAPLSADLNLQNADVADLLALAGESPQGYSGALTANAHVAGTVGNPNGTVALYAAAGTLAGQPFDRIDAQVALTDRLATIQRASLQLGNSHLDLSGTFQHPRDSFTQGQIQASLRSTNVDLGQIRRLPNVAGQLQLSADVSGTLGPAPGTPSQTEFLLNRVQADASVRQISFRGQSYGDLQANIRTAGQTATLNLTSDFAGANLRVNGTTQLVSGYPLTADVQVAGLPIERVLAVAGNGDLPVRGKLSASAHVYGALSHPEGDATVDITGASVYGQPLDRVQLRAQSTSQATEVTSFEAAAGPSHVALTARFDHPVDRFDTGTLQFHLRNGHLDLAHLTAVQNARPGLAGSVEITADGAGQAGAGTPAIRLTNLNADVSAAHLSADGHDLGSLTLAAHTASSNHLDFTLHSDLAGASIEATGNGQLSGNYPVQAQLSFKNVKWSNLSKFLAAPSGQASAFEVTAEGKASVSGPILDSAALQGSVQLSKLDFETLALPQIRTRGPIAIQNQGNIAAHLDRGVLTIDSFHLTGRDTDIRASGTAPLNGGRLDVTVNAGVDLGILQTLSRDINSSGTITLAATVHGTLSSPQALGSLKLQDANFNYADLPNGLNDANGTILLQGNRAQIQNLTAESGGGRVTLSGFATLGNVYRFALHAAATGVRVRIQPGVSVVGNADLHINGNINTSTVTGSVTLTQLNYSPKSDLGSILTRATPSVESATVPNPLLDNMKLDVRVRTSPGMRVKSSLAENLGTDADLRVGGTAARPSLLGRIDLEEGKLLFFGNTYTVDSGSISFADPVRIEPVLNLSLKTEAKGVTVVLNVSGPIENMKLTYTSDPPLQFQEIIGLLSTGAVPTSDPTLLANQPAQPSQTFEQSGESAILGQAIANPVASRLQRVFGVSQLSINPAFTGSSTLPTAQVTLQQRVSTSITFTYISALDDPNSTLISAEWALNPRWSAKALRDQNGIVSVNLLYRKSFH